MKSRQVSFFSGLFLQAFPRQEQPGGGGCLKGGRIWMVDGESPSEMFFLRAPRVKMSREASAGFYSRGVSCKPALGRVQRSLRQRSSSWSQSSCFYQPASAIPEFCPLPSDKLFPISSPIPGCGYTPTFALRWVFILPPPLSWPASENTSVFSP